MTKEFAMDDERLKDSTRFGKDYFDEVITLEQFVHLKKDFSELLSRREDDFEE